MSKPAPKTSQSIKAFQQTVWAHYAKHKRSMPWRDTTNPYWILVSEIMLQQTQVERVTPKFQQFIKKFPNVELLAEASFQDVLRVWSGLGYNRRARYLHRAARLIVKNYGGEIPMDHAELTGLPGVGPNTAGAIRAYAFNQPAVFIETNIRTVFLYHFFQNKADITDAALLPFVEKSLDHQRPREWYWALMDYGTVLKKAHPKLTQASRHYQKQSKFEGSRRQLRAAILRQLLDGAQSRARLQKNLADKRLPDVLKDLQKERLVKVTDNHISLANH